MRLRPKRGFPLGLVQQRHPKDSRSDYLTISRRSNKVSQRSRVSHFLLCWWLRYRGRLERVIYGGDVAGDCDEGTPGTHVVFSIVTAGCDRLNCFASGALMRDAFHRALRSEQV